LQHGSLTGYLRWTLFGLLALGIGAGYAVYWVSGSEGREWLDGAILLQDWPMQGGAWLVAGALILAGAGASLGLRQRMALLMASGLVGYGSAVLFLFTGAPDLAFTQFAVETALVVVAAALLPRYGSPPVLSGEPVLRNALLALACGIGFFALLLQLWALPPDTQLADWFGDASLPLAHGHNVVNVIIVDFRALDTLGEIAVVMFSLLAAAPLLGALARRVRSV
jgi:multicomponent Na+:H+ antiporter subunit A